MRAEQSDETVGSRRSKVEGKGPAMTEGRPANRRRLLALLVDYGVILGWMALLASGAFLYGRVRGGLPDWSRSGAAPAELFGFLLLVLPVGIYLCVGESSSRGATLGKRLLALRVTDARGRSPGVLRVLVRTVVKLGPWEFAHFFLWRVVAGGADGPSLWVDLGLSAACLLPVLYCAMVLLRADGRGPHDLLAGTRVGVAVARSRFEAVHGSRAG